MIKGIGVDIVKISRFNNVNEHFNLAGPNRLEQFPLVLETNMLPLTPRTHYKKFELHLCGKAH